MASLSGATIASTFKSLLKLAGNTDDLVAGADGAGKQVMTGDGEDTTLYINTDRVGMGVSAPACELHIGGTNPQIRIGDDGAEDTSLCFMGNAADFYIGIDDTSDDLNIGTGTSIGSNVKMVIENTGNVGIGTIAPNYGLTIVGDGVLGQMRVHSTDADGTIRIDTSGEDHSSVLSFESGGDSKGLIYYAHNATAASQKMYFKTGDNAVEAMIIDGAGNVGIGTASPAGELEVAASNANADIILTRIDGSIGSTDPIGQLSWRMSDGASDSAITAGIKVLATQTHDGGDFGSQMQFMTSDNTSSTLNNIMLLDSTGKVGIGETSPSRRLHVKEAGDTAYCAMLENTDADNPYGLFINYTGGAPNTDNTDFFIACNDTSSSRFRVSGNGDVDTTTGTDIQAISDERMKENIADFTGGLAIVDALKPRTYTWKSGADRGMTGTRYGFIAQEILATSGVEANMALAKSNPFDEHHPDYEVINECCTDGTLKSSQMSSKECILISAIQELSAKVKALENA